MAENKSTSNRGLAKADNKVREKVSRLGARARWGPDSVKDPLEEESDSKSE